METLRKAIQKASTSQSSPKSPLKEEQGETMKGFIPVKMKHKKHGSKK